MDQLKVTNNALSLTPADKKDGAFTIDHFFTKPNVHPFDEIAWEKRRAAITGQDGQIFFPFLLLEIFILVSNF